MAMDAPDKSDESDDDDKMLLQANVSLEGRWTLTLHDTYIIFDSIKMVHRPQKQR